MHRFYLSDLKFKDETLALSHQRILHQLHKVLRIEEGAEFCLFDGKEEYLVRVEEMSKKKLVVRKRELVVNELESTLKLNLYQAIPKKPALFEWVVQKATEVGVNAIYPLVTERTENRRAGKKERLKTIALEAAEQCGRLHVPEIHEMVTFSKAVNNVASGFLAYENESKNFDLKSFAEIKNDDEINLFIGPEGGFSKAEVELAKSHSIKTFSLGKRILRTETAAVVASALFLMGH